jgi:hypothetical protein
MIYIAGVLFPAICIVSAVWILVAMIKYVTELQGDLGPKHRGHSSPGKPEDRKEQV